MCGLGVTRLLGLCDNELEDNDAIMIAEALQHNTNLRRIGIGSNHFTELNTLWNVPFVINQA